MTSGVSRLLRGPLLNHIVPSKLARAWARQFEARGDLTRMTCASVVGSRRRGKFSIQLKPRRALSVPTIPHLCQSCQGRLAATDVALSRESARSAAIIAVAAPASASVALQRLR